MSCINGVKRRGQAQSIGYFVAVYVSSVSSVKEAHCFIPYPGTEQRFAMQKNV